MDRVELQRNADSLRHQLNVNRQLYFPLKTRIKIICFRSRESQYPNLQQRNDFCFNLFQIGARIFKDSSILWHQNQICYLLYFWIDKNTKSIKMQYENHICTCNLAHNIFFYLSTYSYFWTRIIFCW